jgi:Domain of unknown function (DUF1851)
VFERFEGRFGMGEDGRDRAGPWANERLEEAAGYREFADRYAGCTFERGLYRVHDSVSGPRGEEWVAEAFPEYASRATPFGFDWLGCQFAIDDARQEAGESLVLMLEPGTGEVLEVPATFVSFHDEELVEHTDAALSDDFFALWSSLNEAILPLQHDQCAGYRVPLFLGGKDEVENLELTDLDVYWSLLGQMIAGMADMPEGTRMGDVSIE